MSDDKNGTSKPRWLPQLPGARQTTRLLTDGRTDTGAIDQELPPAAFVRFEIDRGARLIPHAVDQVVLERYRRLRTKLLQMHATQEFRSIMITSASPQEGKTLTVLNLALSFAMIPGFRVAVVDGDLRRGGVGEALGAKDRPGRINVLEGTAKLDEVIVASDELPVHFVLSGTSQGTGTELMQPAFLREQIHLISRRFDLVLVDSAPVNIIADAQLLASCCDAVLLVARAFVTTRKDLEKMAADLQPFRILGTILNGGTQPKRHYRGYY